MTWDSLALVFSSRTTLFFQANRNTIARERFNITAVRQENRIGITVTAKEQKHSLVLLLASQLMKRSLSIDIFVLHCKGNNITVSAILDNSVEITPDQLTNIAAEIRQITGDAASVRIHNPVAKLAIFGHGLCTSRRTSTEIFDKIR